jgi:transcriptional regulator of acetoin/glycerol metabolism
VELQPVWLHRGEHFFADTSVYSCAGAPLFGPDGLCVGMLDLTGIEAVERPELRHMVVQSARSIENALTLRQPHSLLVRLNWPGGAMGEDSDGMICLDGDGWVTGANPTARQMVSQLGVSGRERVHASELFALPFEMLFDASEQANNAMELPLWSGLRLQARAQRPGHPIAGAPAHDRIPLKEVEIALIHKAVADAKGNVQQAARALGISRATVYRKLGRRPPMA